MTVELFTLLGIPLVRQDDDLVALIAEGLARGGVTPRDGDVFVLAQKIVSKAEGRTVDLATVTPSARALQLAAVIEKDPRLVELVLSESASIVFAQRGYALVVEHRLGFVVPMAGIDQSNVASPFGPEKVLLLPVNSDASAETLRKRLNDKFGVQIAVVINDSVSRPWRAGTCGIAIGSAGLPVLNDLRGAPDLFGREMRFSVTGFADEIAAAASLVMGQCDEGTPVVVVRGLKWDGMKTGEDLKALTRPSELTPELVVRL
jgi:coenzyme F420-0:L-glutamate ligase/coenzyme F420-1:gamma-L-glutamate ligase